MENIASNVISHASLSDAKRQVDIAYQEAFSLVHQMRIIGCHCPESHAMHGIVAIISQDDIDEAEEIAQFKEASRQLSRTMSEKADQLVELRDQLEEKHSRLRGLFAPLWELIQFSYSDLGDFVTGSKCWGRAAYPAIEMTAWGVRDWASQCRSVIEESQYSVPFNTRLNLYDKCDKLNDQFPLTQEIEDALRKRLYQEQGQLLRNLPAYRYLFSSDDPQNPSQAEREDSPHDPNNRDIAFFLAYEAWAAPYRKDGGRAPRKEKYLATMDNWSDELRKLFEEEAELIEEKKEEVDDRFDRKVFDLIYDRGRKAFTRSRQADSDVSA